MMDTLVFWDQTDVVGKTVATVLLLMSVTSWVLILYKVSLLLGVVSRMRKATEAFWKASSWEQGLAQLRASDRRGWLVSIALVGQSRDTLQGLNLQSSSEQYLTRNLRQVMEITLQQLQWGQVMLATVGSTAPFVGLLGTVWGIYHALVSIAGGGQISLDKISAPVGEALIMTAAGLAVALPAVLAYNLLGRMIQKIEGQLDGFARDVRAWVLGVKP